MTDKINKLKAKLEQFDMNRERGIYPNDYEKFIDEIAKIVWGND